MNKKLSAVLYGLTFLPMIGFIGCATSEGTKPTVAAPAPQAPQKASKPEIQKAQTPTSLEALRRGEAPTTPRESPLKEIYFNFDRYDLSADARATLKANADWLRKNPSMRVEIEGHCDERGTNEYNLALGAKRAQAAKEYLVSLGISANRVSTISYGEEILVCREQNEGCWQRNRRDRFVTLATKPGV
jgi:peptidoglycan-associated lipoprotein